MTAEALTIRAARLSDADAIAALTKQLGYTTEPSAVADRLSRILARTDQQFVVADLGGRTIGWTHVVRVEYVEAAAFVTIGGLVVDGDHRKQGVGRRLLAYAEAWAAQHGCSVVRLSSTVARTEAHAFYERLGYTKLKTQYSFGKPVGTARAAALRAFVPDIT